MTSKFNPVKIQDKWIRKWTKEKIFEAKPDPEKKKVYLTMTFPSPSGCIW